MLVSPPKWLSLQHSAQEHSAQESVAPRHIVAEHGAPALLPGKHVSSETPSDLLTFPDELPPDFAGQGVAILPLTDPDSASAQREIQTAIAEQRHRPHTITKDPFGARRFLMVILAAAWAVGVLLGFGRIAYGLACIRRLRRESVDVDESSRELLDCRDRP